MQGVFFLSGLPRLCEAVAEAEEGNSNRQSSQLVIITLGFVIIDYAYAQISQS